VYGCISKKGKQITILERTGKLSGLTSNPAEAFHTPKAMVRFPQNSFALFSYPISSEDATFTIWEAMAYDVASGIISALGGGQSASTGIGGLSLDEMASLGNSGSVGAGMSIPGINMPNVQALQYPNLQQGINSMEQGNIGLIMDVYMEMTVELGRTKKQIKEILGMGEGTIIELDKLAGEPVDILVNHKPIAKGEVVVIDENFGVRVTEILSPIERVNDLH